MQKEADQPEAARPHPTVSPRGFQSFSDHGVCLRTDLNTTDANRLVQVAVTTREILSNEFGIGPMTAATILVGDDVDVLNLGSVGKGKSFRHGSYSLSNNSIRINVLHSPIDPRLMERMVAHETVHHAVHGMGIEPVMGKGAWINEGFAALLENIGEEGIDLSDPAPGRLAASIALSDAGQFWSLSRFLNASVEDLNRAPSRKVMTTIDGSLINRSVSLHQTQAFAVALYLYSRHREQFCAAVPFLLRHGASADTLANQLGARVEQMEIEFAGWLAKQGASEFGRQVVERKEKPAMKSKLSKAATALLVVSVASGAVSAQHPVATKARTTTVQQDEKKERFELAHRFRVNQARRYLVGSRITTDVGETVVSNSSRVVRPAVKDAENKWMEFVEKEKCLGMTEEGNHEIEYDCERFHYVEKSGGKNTFEVKVASKKDLRKTDVSDPRVFYLAGLLEKPIRYEIDKSLKVVRVGVPSHLKGSVKSTVEAGFKKGLQGRYDAMFPKTPVAVGESWDGAIAVDSGLWRLSQDIPELDYKTTITLQSVRQEKDRRVAVLDVDIRINVKPDQIISDNTFFKLRLDSVTGSSRIEFDIDEGCPLGEKSLMTVKMTRIMGRSSTMKLHTPLVVKNRITSRILVEGQEPGKIEKAE